MTSEHGNMPSLESLIVGYCQRNFVYSSEMTVKALVAVMVDNSATTFVNVDKTICRDDGRILDVGPRNAVQQWRKSQNSELVPQQNQWLQQQKPRMRGEIRSPLSTSQRFRMPQMTARVRMQAPPVQSPKMSSVRMQQPYVPQSVVRLNKIPSHVDSSQSAAMALFSVAKSALTRERHAVAELDKIETAGATRDCFLPFGAEIEDGRNQMNNPVNSLSTAANKNRRKNVNQSNLLVGSGRENGDSREPWKKVPKLPSGQNVKKPLMEQSEEGQEEDEAMKEVEETKNGKPHKPKVGKGDSKELQKKISKMPLGQKTRKALVEREEAEEEVKSKQEEEGEEKHDRPTRSKSLQEMTASLPATTQEREAVADEHLTSKAAPRKRAKKAEHVDEAKMPKLEKEGDKESFWNTFVSKGTGRRKAVAKQPKS